MAELQGVMAGVVSVVICLTTNVNHVTQIVGDMAQVVSAAPNPDNTQGVCMPSMQLPSFRRDFQITRATHPADIASSCQNTFVISGTTVCWRLAKILVVDRYYHRRP